MEYLKIWVDFREVIEPLNDAEKGRLFDAMLSYAADGEEPGLSGNERYIWAYARQSIDRARAESERLRVNGSKGGRPRNQEEAKETKENQPKPTRSRFVPPTVEDVRAYCNERKNNVDPQKFIDFYASKGWKVGNTPMKDWKACVRTWEQRDKVPAKTVNAQQYEQRDYSDEESLDDILNSLRSRA